MSENPVFRDVFFGMDNRLKNIIQEIEGRYLFNESVTENDVISFAKSLLEYRVSNRPKMDKTTLVKDFCILQLSAEKNEVFSMIYLDTKLKLLGFDKLFAGSLNYVHIYPRKIITRAIKYNAYAVVLVHNHPTGDVKPSQDDMELTKSLQSLLKSVEVRMVDHIIVGGGKSYSMSENGLI